jgi:hypothetical protein
MGAPIRLSQLSIFTRRPRPSVMAVIKGYADDSRPNDRIWAVGGYAGNELQWERFEELWPKMLERHGVPYFHMREMADPNGVYAKWHPFKDHYDEVAAFFADMTKVIGEECFLRAFFSITRVKDLERFNAETGLSLQAYPMAAYGCMLGIANDLQGLTIEIIFDHVEKISSKLAAATEYLESDSYYPGVNDLVVPIPLNQKTTFRELAPLQAADFLTWEVQKNHLNIEDWFLQPNKPVEQEDRSEHLDDWSLQKYGTLRPKTRKSLEALIDSGAPAVGMIWDYDNLYDAHRAREGVWFLSDHPDFSSQRPS